MYTLGDGIEATQKAAEVLQTILDEETLEYFTGPQNEATERAGRRMLEIGPLLYSNPRDALHISLWEGLAAIHPRIQFDEEYARSLFRPGTWELTTIVTAETTWDELEDAVWDEIPESRTRSKGSRAASLI